MDNDYELIYMAQENEELEEEVYKKYKNFQQIFVNKLFNTEIFRIYQIIHKMIKFCKNGCKNIILLK